MSAAEQGLEHFRDLLARGSCWKRGLYFEILAV
jgi:hypothetical protein